MAGHQMEIWSARSQAHYAVETVTWLERHVGQGRWEIAIRADRRFFAYDGGTTRWTLAPVVIRMHAWPIDVHPTAQLALDCNRSWLEASRREGAVPELVFEREQWVVDMWQEEMLWGWSNIMCFQLASRRLDQPSGPCVGSEVER